jgi:hypothetical protein
VRLNVTAASVRSARDTYPYGETASLPLDSGEALALIRAAIPADLPDNAIVTTGDLVVFTKSSLTGSRTVSAQQCATGFSVSKATWDNKPAGTGSSASTTVGAVAAGTEVRVDVLSQVQDIIAGTVVNRGWRLTTSDTTAFSLIGSSADADQPYLDLEYILPGDAPVDLSPDGAAVSVAKPTLTATVPDETISIQVQIDAAADSVSPDFDSGEVASTAGLLDLTATAYAGLSLAASTSWRMRAKNGLGWSDWSDWATFSRIAKPTITFVTPGSTTGDPTPPITWTAPGQVSWQVRTFNDATGAKLDDSGREVDDDAGAWTPTKGIRKVGQETRIVLRVWDDEDRVATPGDPEYAEATLVTELVTASSDPGIASLTATSGLKPWVRLAWTGEADEWQIVRDGKHYDRIDGTRHTFTDYLAKPRHTYKYKVLPVSEAGVGAISPTVTVTPKPAGLWLFDGSEYVLVTEYDVAPVWDEQAVEHNILGGAVGRRRIGTPPPRGTVLGRVVDGGLGDMAEMVETALSFKASSQNRVYRMAWGDKNVPVTIGDLMVETFDDAPDVYEITFKWWQTNDELPWDRDA